MEGKKILYVNTQMSPYLPETKIAEIALEVPKAMIERGNEVRVFMPKFGHINERRFQLHEVIRLSGMNLSINDFDQPLIIKVASIQEAQLQVYFIDNEEYFNRKHIEGNEETPFFHDNDERAIFYCKGVLETIRKLNWAPDIVHITGWLGLMIPLYIKKYYHEDPLFKNTQVIISLSGIEFEGNFSKDFHKKIAYDGFKPAEVKSFSGANYLAILPAILKHTAGVLLFNEVNEEIQSLIKNVDFVEKYESMDSICELYQQLNKEDILLS